MNAHTSHGALAAEIVDLRKGNAELLAALRGLLQETDQHAVGGCHKLHDACAAARAAIAKAEVRP